MLEGNFNLERSTRPIIRDFADNAFDGGHHKKAKHLYVKIIALSVVGVVMIVGGFLLLAFSPWFFVSEVKISGLEFMNETQIRSAVDTALNQKKYRIFPSKHRLFVDTESIKRELENNFGFSEVAVMEKGGVISIILRERPTGVFVTDGKHPVFADLKGIVIREADLNERELVGKGGTSLPFLVLIVEGELMVKPGDRLFTEGLLANYQSLKLHFEVETGLPTLAYILPRQNASWIRIKLADNREIYADLSRSVEPQIEKLLTLMRAKGAALDKVGYIDLRFSDRVYYK